jgi:hypothetical protein
VKDFQSQDLTFKRLKQECEDRLGAQSGLSGIPSAALTEFAEFLLSPGFVEQLKTIEKPPKDLTEMLGAKSAPEVGEMLLTAPSKAAPGTGQAFQSSAGQEAGEDSLPQGIQSKD